MFLICFRVPIAARILVIIAILIALSIIVIGVVVRSDRATSWRVTATSLTSSWILIILTSIIRVATGLLSIIDSTLVVLVQIFSIICLSLLLLSVWWVQFFSPNLYFTLITVLIVLGKIVSVGRILSWGLTFSPLRIFIRLQTWTCAFCLVRPYKIWWALYQLTLVLLSSSLLM